ncbi:MAG: hypothetical protein JWP97_732 [Labilithrix sp.]|nr:hypothetical protein [Labilithrix sp.]
MRARAIAIVVGLGLGACPASARAEPLSGTAREQLVRECQAFEKDYEVSRSPLLLAMLGSCGLRLERDGEAIAAYARYLGEARSLTEIDRDAVVSDVQQLSATVARLTLHVGGARVHVLDARVPFQGERIVNAYGPTGDEGVLVIGVRPGHHVIQTKLDGYEDQRWELDVEVGSREEHRFVLMPIVPVPPPRPHPGRGAVYGPWLLAGAGGAMLVAGAISGGVALGKQSRIDDHCQAGRCPSSFDLEGERASGKRFAAASDVLLIGGALAVAGGAVWYWLGTGRKSSASGAGRAGVTSVTRATSVVPTATCSATGCFGGLRAAF